MPGKQHGKKPDWVIEKERQRKTAPETVWLFGLHAVRDALKNPNRKKLRLVLTLNAKNRLEDALEGCDIEPEIVHPRKFNVPIDANSVHQGAALEVKPLEWGNIEQICYPHTGNELVVLLDRVTDPHNVGAILRSAEVFGAKAVIGPLRYSAPETGALAKTASGALERQPYLQVRNLSATMEKLKEIGYSIVGLDGQGDETLEEALGSLPGPMAVVLGAEGPGMREKTTATCDKVGRISAAADFASLNVSNAAVVALYAARASR